MVLRWFVFGLRRIGIDAARVLRGSGSAVGLLAHASCLTLWICAAAPFTRIISRCTTTFCALPPFYLSLCLAVAVCPAPAPLCLPHRSITPSRGSPCCYALCRATAVYCSPGFRFFAAAGRRCATSAHTRALHTSHALHSPRYRGTGSALHRFFLPAYFTAASSRTFRYRLSAFVLFLRSSLRASSPPPPLRFTTSGSCGLAPWFCAGFA